MSAPPYNFQEILNFGSCHLLGLATLVRVQYDSEVIWFILNLLWKFDETYCHSKADPRRKNKGHIKDRKIRNLKFEVDHSPKKWKYIE